MNYHLNLLLLRNSHMYYLKPNSKKPSLPAIVNYRTHYIDYRYHIGHYIQDLNIEIQLGLLQKYQELYHRHLVA